MKTEKWKKWLLFCIGILKYVIYVVCTRKQTGDLARPYQKRLDIFLFNNFSLKVIITSRNVYKFHRRTVLIAMRNRIAPPT